MLRIRPRAQRALRTAVVPIAITVVALFAGCSGDSTEDADATVAGVMTQTTTAAPTEAAATTATVAPTETVAPPDDAPLYDPSLVRTDVDCSLEFISSGGGEDFADGFTSGHFVVDGVLGEPCLGEDERLLNSWEWLRTVAGAEDLTELILFAGFDAPSDLLAYVEALNTGEGEVAFQMTVNLGQADADDIELALTMAHELTHVFTGVPDQLDRGVDESQCTTYFEGEGCYTEGSFIARWVEEFWGDWIADVDPLNDDDEAALERCIADPSFLGSYAATNPEEDFAETFSAWVFSVPVEDPGLISKYEFFEADEYLASFKARVQAAGIEPLPNQFEGCGF